MLRQCGGMTAQRGAFKAAAPARKILARRPLHVVAAANPISSNDFRPGVTVELEGVPYRVVEFLHVKPGKGAAFVRSKLKNCFNGTVMERTFRAGEMVAGADLLRREAQYTYAEGEQYVFMDQETYEETRLTKDDSWAKYLKEGTVCSLLFHNGKCISVEPPAQVELLVVDCPPNVKGNTVSGGSKPAVLETGATINVPLFINNGELIKLDTRTDSYLARGKE